MTDSKSHTDCPLHDLTDLVLALVVSLALPLCHLSLQRRDCSKNIHPTTKLGTDTIYSRAGYFIVLTLRVESLTLCHCSPHTQTHRRARHLFARFICYWTVPERETERGEVANTLLMPSARCCVCM